VLGFEFETRSFILSDKSNSCPGMNSLAVICHIVQEGCKELALSLFYKSRWLESSGHYFNDIGRGLYLPVFQFLRHL